MNAQRQDPLGDALAESSAPGGRSVAQKLVEMADDSYVIVRGKDGKTYGHRVGHHIAWPLRGANSVRSRLSSDLYEGTGRVANQNALGRCHGVAGDPRGQQRR